MLLVCSGSRTETICGADLSILRIYRAFCWKAFLVMRTPTRELFERFINTCCRESVACSSMLRQ